MAVSDILGVSARDTNRLRILEALLRYPARSRGELGRALGLSRATVTAVLSELERAGMVDQQADGSADERRGIGRPPLQVSLASDAAFAVGLDFGHRHIRAAVCDLGGRIVADRSEASAVDQHASASFDAAQRLTTDVLAEAGVDTARVIGVGVGLAAPVDATSGTVHAAGILPGWTGIAPAQELEMRLGMPVRVENGANAGALGEHLFGAGRGAGDMIYLRISSGVGLGLIMGGQLYGGVAGVAGEIGHITAVPDGLICRCGNRGCLETIVSPAAIAELLGRSRGETVDATDLIELLRSGDRGVHRAIADAGRTIGETLAATVNILNPGLVIVGGELAEAGDVLLDPIRAAIGDGAVAPAASSVRVIVGELGERAEVLGAATTQLARAPQALANRLG
jgi:predicted NBD/HSP70 family sugar kinase/DNA-binding transcriptional ArsR family regulator